MICDDISSFFCSVAGFSATIFAYLGEFHTSRQRDRAIMAASVIFATACNLVPVVVWAVMNQEWKLRIPLLNITYGPWRSYIVTCALPGLISHLMLYFVPESPKFVIVIILLLIRASKIRIEEINGFQFIVSTII